VSKAKPATKIACPECGHTRAQFDWEDGRCMAIMPGTGGEHCGCTSDLFLEVAVTGTHTAARRQAAVDKPAGYVGHAHPQTAQAMQARALPSSGTLRRLVYDTIAGAGTQGMTDDEIEIALSRSHQSVSGCRNSLMNDGLLIDSGLRRRTRYDNDAVAWAIAPLEEVVSDPAASV